MKSITFASAFVLTILIIILGTATYPMVFGPAMTYNTEYVFGFFLGTFFVLLLLGWIGEKTISILKKPRKKKQAGA